MMASLGQTKTFVCVTVNLPLLWAHFNISRRMRWAGNVARMGAKRNAHTILLGNPEGKRPLGRQTRGWVNNIKMNLREIGWGGMGWIDLVQNRESSGSIKCWEVLEQLHNWRLLKKDSVP
jgi:hypothetical protein